MKRRVSLHSLPTYQISRLQLLGFVFSSIIGLFIITLAVQLYQDIAPLFSSKEHLSNKEYMVLTKKVRSLSTIGSALGMGDYKRFSKKEIEQLEMLKGVRKIAPLQVARYQVIASVDHSLGGEGMASLLSFESLPTSFLDVNPAQWNFNPEQPSIPIIIPKDFLALYNFSLAESQGLPQLSEAIIRQISIDFQLIGSNGRILHLKGSVVGFTQRLNAFIVPEDFLQWSNRLLTSDKEALPSRLILEIEPADAPIVAREIEEKGYEIAGDKSTNSEVVYLFRVSLSIVLFVGLLITLLAFSFLMLSLHLIIVKNKERIQILYLLGYTPQEVAYGYNRLVIGVNLLAWVLAIAAVQSVRFLYVNYLKDWTTFTFEWGGIFCSFLLVTVLTLLHVGLLRRRLSSYWQS